MSVSFFAPLRLVGCCVQWAGASANTYEKAKAAEVVTKIRNTRGARPEIILMGTAP
jgi:hypothetical protein